MLAESNNKICIFTYRFIDLWSWPFIPIALKKCMSFLISWVYFILPLSMQPPPPPPPPGGGGRHFHPYMLHERPPFSVLNSLLKHIIFTNDKIYSAPEHHHFTFLPFRRPSFSKFLYVQAIHRCERKAFGQRPGVSSRPECQPDVSYTTVSSEDPPLSRSSSLWSPRSFTLELAPEPPPPPIFHFAVAHTYQTLGWVPPPPPDAALVPYLKRQ